MFSSLLFIVLFGALSQLVSCATLWSGNFNSYSTSTDLDAWSFSNPNTGEYETYIYGNQNPSNEMSTFVAMSPAFLNTADTSAKQGIRVEINANSTWNGQTMLRTELIARFVNGSNAVEQGTVWYQFSMMQGSQNPLNSAYEHQLVFFESHFADIKYGGSGGANLWFMSSNGQSLWTSPFTSDLWHNFALQVDYTNSQVSLWHSTGGAKLQQVVQSTATSASVSDWHVGHLRLPLNGAQDPTPEWVYYSSIYANTAIVPFGAVASPPSELSSSQHEEKEAGGVTSGGAAALFLVALALGFVVGGAIIYYLLRRRVNLPSGNNALLPNEQ